MWGVLKFDQDSAFVSVQSFAVSDTVLFKTALYQESIVSIEMHTFCL